MPPIRPIAPLRPTGPRLVPGSATANGRAVALMIAAMALFATDDAMIKFAATLPDGATPGQIIAFHGTVGALVFGAIMTWRGETLTRDLVTDWAVIARTAGDVLAACAFVTALTLMPLGNASAILQVQPLVVTLAAALLLGEAVGWRRRVAIAIGFVGVLVIIRPGLEGFTAVSLLVLLGVVGLVLRDLATRTVGVRHSTFAISTVVCVAIVPAGAVLHLAFGTGELTTIGREALLVLAAASVIGNVGYWCITQAARIGEVSAIAPHRYARLVFAVALGWLVFDEVPDGPMIVGSLLVIGAGIYAMTRERSAPPSSPASPSAGPMAAPVRSAAQRSDAAR